MSKNLNKCFVGIDGGKAGGICILNEDQEIEQCIPIPLVDSAKGKTYDVIKISRILAQFKPLIACLEEAHPMFRDGGKQSFTTGELFGSMKTLLLLEGIPFEIVKSVTWQKKIFAGTTVKDTKGASIEYCRRKFPNFDFTATERSKKISDGMTDATCIAEYCRMRNSK